MDESLSPFFLPALLNLPSVRAELLSSERPAVSLSPRTTYHPGSGHTRCTEPSRGEQCCVSIAMMPGCAVGRKRIYQTDGKSSRMIMHHCKLNGVFSGAGGTSPHGRPV
ncbi:unnamed protein product [Pleuronectes platessa]|uniref:Uncharacterized protein n=1 Tax=Pleuronectes platessa TaxID=8262 RepID=A0A9N7VG35_PLEPL|nr:unnamed protein product [Pleuronectes platessa]